MTARLLVVDDEELNREIIREFLDSADCDLAEAESGEAALALLESQEFDAVLLDRMMPGLDGIEVLQRIRDNARLADLPVIFQTAAATQEQIAEGLRLGAYYYLTKPYDRDALTAVVDAALQLGRQRRELTRRLSALNDAASLFEDAHYRFRTLEEAQAVAAALAAACAEPERAGMGFVELLVNAVEHGNLGIDFEEKARLLQSGQWEGEILARLALPANKDKFVDVRARRRAGELVVVVKDQGSGFDWCRFLSIDQSRVFYPNGRGIALAREVAFNSVQYRGCGNEVEVRVTCREHLPAAASAAHAS